MNGLAVNLCDQPEYECQRGKFQRKRLGCNYYAVQFRHINESDSDPDPESEEKFTILVSNIF